MVTNMTKLEQPDLRPIRKGVYVLKSNFTYSWEEDNKQHSLTIPKGEETDGASAPRIVWTLSGIRPDGLQRAASLLHDFAYKHQGDWFDLYPKAYKVVDIKTGKKTYPKKKWTRKRCDKLFLRALKDYLVKMVKRLTMYWSVRTCGWAFW